MLTACAGGAQPAASSPASATTAAPPTALAQAGGAAIVADGQIMPAALTRLAFAAGGLVAEVLVQAGDVVNAGDLVARLGGREALEAASARAQQAVREAELALMALTKRDPLTQAQAELTAANAQIELDQAQRKLRRLQDPGAPAYAAEVARVQAELLNAQGEAQLAGIGELAQALQAAQKRWETAAATLADAQAAQAQCPGCGEVYAGGRMVKLADAQQEHAAAQDAAAAARIRLEQAQRAANARVAELEQRLQSAQARLAAAGNPEALAVAQAEAEVRLAQARLDDAQAQLAGPDPAQLAAAQGRLDAAQAEYAAAQASARLIELRAPMAGVVVALGITAGEHIGAGQTAMQVAALGRWIVRTTNLTEMEVPALRVGQAATVRVDALPGANFHGAVTAIAANFEARNGDVLYAVEIALADADPRLRWGMTAEVVFGP